MSALLEVDGLRMHFFTKAGVVKAVDDVSFRVERGRILGLVGESGSGKSMTGYSIMGLVDAPGRIVQGRISLDGRNLAGLDEAQWRALRGNRIAMIFQDPMMTLNPVLRIDTQMIEAVLAHENVGKAVARERARNALARVGIGLAQRGKRVAETLLVFIRLGQRKPHRDTVMLARPGIGQGCLDLARVVGLQR